MNVRYASSHDLAEIVRIHLDRFENFFLSSLGNGFLEVYYRSFLKKPGVLLVLEDEGKIQGFASGCPSNTGFYRKLLKANIASYFIVGIKLLLVKPKALLRIFTNMKSSGRGSLIYAELLSIATVKNKKGYGSVLLNAFEVEMTKLKESHAINALSLTTDFENNEKAIRFYKGNGYKESSVFESYEKRKMYRFIKQL
jgi:ribosomal protein S18 acetylase RimI-like enzyme